jgi:hypothetical protein
MAYLTVDARPQFDDTRENLYVEDGKIVTRLAEGAMPPPSIVIVHQISNRQFFHALALTHEITKDEALVAVQGKLPARITQILDELPEDQRFSAQMLLSGATQFERHHPLVESLADALGWKPEEVDALWILAGSL